MELEKNIRTYMDDIASNSPTPGGGNVSAFAAALACSLGIMVCNLTLGKKKYADIEQEVLSLKSKLTETESTFLNLGGEDNAAFENVMEAFKLPKETDEQKNIRLQQIEEATISAADVPARVIKKCSETMPYIISISEIGNQNGVSDAAVALSLIQAAAQGAFMNVLINCSTLSNKTAAGQLLKGSEVILNEVKHGCSEAINKITMRLIK